MFFDIAVKPESLTLRILFLLNKRAKGVRGVKSEKKAGRKQFYNKFYNAFSAIRTGQYTLKSSGTANIQVLKDRVAFIWN